MVVSCNTNFDASVPCPLSVALPFDLPPRLLSSLFFATLFGILLFFLFFLYFLHVLLHGLI